MGLAELLPAAVFVAVPHVYLGAVLALTVPRGLERFLDGRFTRRKFYVLMGWVPLCFLAVALVFDLRYLAMLAVCGAAGVVGETIVSIAWQLFFREPIWTYSHGALLSGVTSTLNFLPWAVGAFLFHAAESLAPMPSRGSPLVVAAASLAATALVVWLPFLCAYRRRFSGLAFAVFCAPIFVTAAALGISCGPAYLRLMAMSAGVGFVFEHGYGRAMSVFFGTSLWTYNRWRIDGGHASFASLPLWALGGLYFHFVNRALGL
jgi:hypothetical protein